MSIYYSLSTTPDYAASRGMMCTSIAGACPSLEYAMQRVKDLNLEVYRIYRCEDTRTLVASSEEEGAY